ncbi:hypothetical protein [Microbacterium sp. PMB16]|uniref:hypothetical protein n=1 Tax=Microbacterium sp. PMB16 TaxID=3120157 RepID=UPI003F4AF9EF
MTRRRWWAVGGMAGLIVAAVAGVWIWQATTRVPTAEEAASSYVRALESGSPEAVEATGIEVSETALAAFADATGWMEAGQVEAVAESEDGTATADIAFRLAGEEQTAQIPLSIVDGRWRVDAAALGAMTATTTVGSFVGIGDTRLPVGEAVPLLPAEYAVAATPAELLEGESALVVLPGTKTDLAVEVALRDTATDAAQKQLDDHLEDCMKPAGEPAAGCGIRIPWGTEFRSVSEIRYRIEQAPAITLTATEFSAADGVLVATVTGTGQDGAARTATYRTESWSIRGDVSFTAADLVLTPW